VQRAASNRRSGDKAPPGSWSWLKLWTGYVVTVLPYVSALLVLVPGLSVLVKAGILCVFGAFVLTVRVLHEKAGVEVTGRQEKQKRPGDGR
jgi:hypothetical protein